MPPVRTAFDPKIDGFHFYNYFEPIPQTIPLAGIVHPGSLVIGLCGGMSFASLDYFHAAKSIPPDLDAEKISDPLRDYLVLRQTESLPPETLVRLVEWLTQPDATVAQQTEANEAVHLRALLDSGQPAVLCLVRTRGLGDPTGNHQVVATGYDLDSTPGMMNIFLSDPNHPYQDGINWQEPYLTIPAAWQPGGALSQSTGEPLRGFFLMSYSPSANLPNG